MDIDNPELNEGTCDLQTPGDNSDKLANTEYADTAAAARQAQDAVLDDLSALAVIADNEFIVGTGAGTYANESGDTARISLGVGSTDTPSFSGVNLAGGKLNIGSPVELTIATGEITITQSNHTIDTESDASSDDLDTIHGGVEGDLLYLRATSGARTVVVKSGTGNIFMGGDFSMNSALDTLLLRYASNLWVRDSNANNAA